MRSNLAAFHIERRRISVAVFVDDHLEFTGSRQLPSVFVKASESVGRYVAWIASNFHLEAAAVEQNQSKRDTWRSRFTRLVIAQLRTAGIPVFEVEKTALLASFAHPTLRYRTELRSVVSSIWPILATKDTPRSHLDAAALGLHVQVDRLFGATPQTSRSPALPHESPRIQQSFDSQSTPTPLQTPLGVPSNYLADPPHNNRHENRRRSHQRRR